MEPHSDWSLHIVFRTAENDGNDDYDDDDDDACNDDNNGSNDVDTILVSRWAIYTS